MDPYAWRNPPSNSSSQYLLSLRLIRQAVNHMPETQSKVERKQLFYALADPTRRQILELLAANGEMSATAVYGNFTMSHPAVSQHLGVLRQAELVRVEKSAQRHIYSVNPEGIRELENWVTRFTGLWDERFENLDQVLEKEKRRGKKAGR
jgi:DNA-binding transcriptional ArsR family regulator